MEGEIGMGVIEFNQDANRTVWIDGSIFEIVEVIQIRIIKSQYDRGLPCFRRDVSLDIIT